MLLNGKNYELKATGGTLLIFKEEFGENMFNVISHIDRINEDIDIAFELIWAMAKTVDKTIPSFKEWYGSIPFAEITRFITSGNFTEIFAAINENFEPSKEVKKN